MATNLYGLIEQRPGHPNFGHPFYVGIGGDKRPHQHVRLARSPKGHYNPVLHVVLMAHLELGIEPPVRIFGTYPTSHEAALAEIDAILSYGRVGIEPHGILCNLSGGGEGADPESMRGVKKVRTAAGIAARQANARIPKSAEALALQLAAVRRNWADPEFRAARSASQAVAWQDPEKRANMMEGRSEAQRKLWEDPEVREKRTTNVSAAIASKWENDPDYAARSRAGLKAAWADPERKAERVAKMLATRAANGVTRTERGRAKQADTMRAVNAGKSAEDRSAQQAATWADPEVRARRTSGLQKAAQDPALKAARLAAMAEGKRRKEAARTTEEVATSSRGRVVEHEGHVTA